MCRTLDIDRPPTPERPAPTDDVGRETPTAPTDATSPDDALISTFIDWDVLRDDEPR